MRERRNCAREDDRTMHARMTAPCAQGRQNRVREDDRTVCARTTELCARGRQSRARDENRACENDGTVCVRTTPAEPCVRGRQHPQTASLCSILFSMLSMVIGVHHVWRHCRRADADDDEVVRDSSHHNLSFQVLISQFFASRLPPPHFSESISPRSLPW